MWILITLIKNQIQQFVDFNNLHMQILIEKLNLSVCRKKETISFHSVNMQIPAFNIKLHITIKPVMIICLLLVLIIIELLNYNVSNVIFLVFF